MPKQTDYTVDLINLDTNTISSKTKVTADRNVDLDVLADLARNTLGLDSDWLISSVSYTHTLK